MGSLRSGPPIPPLRILHVVGTANGAAWVHEQLRDLRARGHDATALIAGADGTLAPRLDADGIGYEVADLDIFAGGSPLTAARRILSLARIFRRLRPDVVQYHVFASIILGRLAAWLADVPVRFSMIPGPYYLEAPGLSGADVRTAPLDTKVIASCEYTRELYERHGVSRTHVELIYYGQDPCRFDPTQVDPTRVRRELGIHPTRPVVGDVAYFYPPSPDGPFTPSHLIGRGIKGHEVLLHAAPLVLAEVPDALFLLVGSGWGPEGEGYQRQLEALAADLGVADAVRFTGPRVDIPETLAAFDVSVQCSLNENLGGSIESLLMARPLVASAVGGLVDAVVHERTGLLVPPGDAPALAQAIIRLLRDRSLAHRVATEGRAHALSLLTLNTTIDNLEALYAREVAALRGRAGYRLWKSAGRAVRLGLNGRRLAQPVRKAVEDYRQRTAVVQPHRIEPGSLHSRHERARHLQLWGAPATARGARNADGAESPPDSPRIVQVAGVVSDADWLITLCRDLKASGANVAAILAEPEGSVAVALREAGVPYQTLGFGARRLTGPIGQALGEAMRLSATTAQLNALFRREQIGVVHVHISGNIVGARVAAWMAGVPCRVSTVSSRSHSQRWRAAWIERVTRWMDHHVVTDGTVDTVMLYATHVTPAVDPETDR